MPWSKGQHLLPLEGQKDTSCIWVLLSCFVRRRHDLHITSVSEERQSGKAACLGWESSTALSSLTMWNVPEQAEMTGLPVSAYPGTSTILLMEAQKVFQKIESCTYVLQEGILVTFLILIHGSAFLLLALIP